MDVEILARVQFAFTIMFHYIFPPLSIGLGVVLVMMEGMYLKTKEVRFHNMTRFWTKIFALTFAIGVASGIVMEFEFGTNWATYSRYVGDVFGSPLAAEGIFAFFLESGFLAVLLFGWDKVGPKMHFFSTLMVALGSHFSAVWIVVANSWMQTPAGYQFEYQPPGQEAQYLPAGTEITDAMMPHTRAVITDFWELVFNPSSMDRLIHVTLGAWLAGAFLVLSVSAWYLLKNRHSRFARTSIKFGLGFATIAMLLQLVSGDFSARGVAKNQPPKLAAMEGIFKTQTNAPLGLIGWVDEETETRYALEIPGLLSFLVHHDFEGEIIGLEEYPKEDWPPVNRVYQMYHLMIGIGMILLAIVLTGCFLWWRGRLFDTQWWLSKWYLRLLVPAVLLPMIANQAGWLTAEFGRQPWVVWEMLRTSDALSKAVTANQVLASLIGFFIVYLLLLALFLYLLNKKIQTGPSDVEESSALPQRWQDALSHKGMADK